MQDMYVSHGTMIIKLCLHRKSKVNTLINTQPIMVQSLIAGTKTMVFPAISLTVGFSADDG